MEPISTRLTLIAERLNLDTEQMSEYLGVPHHTLRKWRTGERIPSAVVHKLLDVLGTLETLSPDIHAAFVPK